MSSLGIMQGRLVPPEPGRFQAFPRRRWMDEFPLAAQVPLTYIEWIYDVYAADVNPLTNDEELPQALALIQNTGVAVCSLCADYFMDLPLLRCTVAQREKREQFLHELLRSAKKMGIRRIVLPFVDASRIESAEERDTVSRIVNNAVSTAREAALELHLETALQPAEFADLLERIPDGLVKVNYDSGNSSSLGYSFIEEFAAYGERIGSIHIKDRTRGGGTVPLGSGDTDFAALFKQLEKAGYRGDFTLQAARAESGDELAWARRNRSFVTRLWPLGE
ncbi:MAG: sugar phosphate isomerase/epimerase family protein [Bryobacteraceae bacterium]